MNAYELQQIKFMGFPSGSIMPVNNTTKKIQNYQFKLNEVLGKGNFSKVYRGVNELTSKTPLIQTSPLQSKWWSLAASRLQLWSTFYIPKLRYSKL